MSRATVAFVFAYVGAFVKRARNTHANRSLAGSNRGQMQDLPGVIIMIGVAIVAGFTVLYLANEVIQILNMSDGGPNSTADPLYESFQSLEQATNSAFGLFGFLFILVIMAVGIAYLYRLTNR